MSIKRMAQRRDTAANWTAGNPILLSGEIGYETDTGKFKFGDGSSTWNLLSYAGMPPDVMEYKGSWNASTNSPTLADGSGNTGDLYRVGTAGTRNLGSGSLTFALGDDVIYNGSTWEKIGGSGVSGLVPTAVKTTSYTAAVNDFVICDATTAFTITLPTTPVDGARIGAKVVLPANPTATQVILIATGGSDVFNKTGGGTTLTLPLTNQATVLQYQASSGIWYVVSTDVPLGATDTRYRYFVNIRDYGALGNGTTDDTSKVQAAIDAVTAVGGGIVWIPVGNFVVSKITLKQKVSILGAGGEVAFLKAKSGTTGTDFGVIEMAQGQIDNIFLENFGIQGNGNTGQWAIYLKADKGAGSTGGMYQSRFSHLNIVNIDNDIWLRGGQTGSVEPHQFITLENITASRTAAGGGVNLQCTGQTNQITRINCLWQSASVGTTRTGTAMYFGRDPLQLANASARYPQGNSGILDSVQGANWLVDIESGANLVFQTPYMENALNAFRVRSVNVSNPTDVTIINPRYAAVATTTEVPTTGGTLIDIGDYCDVRVKGPGFISPGVGTIPTPYVIQNDSTSGGSAAVNLSVEGFITNALDTTLFNVPYPVKTMTNAGTASVATLGAWKAIRFRGRGVGAASLGTIQSLHAPGESIYFVVTSVALDINNTDNIILPGGASLAQLAVGDQGRFTKFYDGTSFKWRLEIMGYAATALSAGSANVLATPRTINGVSFNGSANITIPNVKRVVSPAVAGTYTIDITATDVYVIGTQTATITNITTTGTIADTLTNIIVRIKGDATPRAITWDSTKIATTASAPLPSTTVASKTILVGLMPDAVLGKLVCVSVDAVGY